MWGFLCSIGVAAIIIIPIFALKKYLKSLYKRIVKKKYRIYTK